MPHIIECRTERLKLRQWSAADKAPFAAMCADRKVMEFYPRTLSAAESDAAVDKCASLIAERGWGFWAVERVDTGGFIGFVGLHVPQAQLPFSPCVEIGWRLARAHWGHGYATEAAAAALDVGFGQLDLHEIVAFAVVGNRRSRAVMERLGMHDTGRNFEHPDVPEPSHLREHCLYSISRECWRAEGPRRRSPITPQGRT